MVNIKELNKAEVLAALFNNSKVQGLNAQLVELGIIEKAKNITKVDAQILLDGFGDHQIYFHYLNGKVMKIDLTSDEEFDERLYDRDNGAGAAQKTIDDLRKVNRILSNTRNTDDIIVVTFDISVNDCPTAVIGKLKGDGKTVTVINTLYNEDAIKLYEIIYNEVV